MTSRLKRLIKRMLSAVRLPYGDTALDRVGILGLSNCLQLWFFQRVLRVNAHVRWPVHWTSVFSYPERIQRSELLPYFSSPGLYVQATNGIHVGRNARIGPGAKLISANHCTHDYALHEPAPPIRLGDDVWIGANAVILPGVQLGDHVVVGAGAVVTRSFLQNDILIAGVPARQVRQLPTYAGSHSLLEVVQEKPRELAS